MHGYAQAQTGWLGLERGLLLGAQEAGLEGTWVNVYAPYVRRYGAGDSLTREEAEGIPAANLYLTSAYWAATTVSARGAGGRRQLWAGERRGRRVA